MSGLIQPITIATTLRVIEPFQHPHLLLLGFKPGANPFWHEMPHPVSRIFALLKRLMKPVKIHR